MAVVSFYFLLSNSIQSHVPVHQSSPTFQSISPVPRPSRSIQSHVPVNQSSPTLQSHVPVDQSSPTLQSLVPVENPVQRLETPLKNSHTITGLPTHAHSTPVLFLPCDLIKYLASILGIIKCVFRFLANTMDDMMMMLLP